MLKHLTKVYTQLCQIYSQGSEQFTRVAAKNPMTGKLEEKKVNWFNTVLVMYDGAAIILRLTFL